MHPNVREQMWGFEPTPRQKRKRTRRRLYERGDQCSLAHVRTHGGPRDGAGRPKARDRRRNVRHRTRPKHARYMPVHITMRGARGLPSLRSERLLNLVLSAIRRTVHAVPGFRIVQYSVQRDHLHMLIEADDGALLTKGMRSFSVRLAMLINYRIFGRKHGRVWGDRYHRRDLGSPHEVRSALVYVLCNHLKHGDTDVGLLDPCSSAPWFSGWVHALEPPKIPCAAAAPDTWLLKGGWLRAFPGHLHLGEKPRPQG